MLPSLRQLELLMVGWRVNDTHVFNFYFCSMGYHVVSTKYDVCICKTIVY